MKLFEYSMKLFELVLELFELVLKLFELVLNMFGLAWAFNQIVVNMFGARCVVRWAFLIAIMCDMYAVELCIGHNL